MTFVPFKRKGRSIQIKPTGDPRPLIMNASGIHYETRRERRKRLRHQAQLEKKK